TFSFWNYFFVTVGVTLAALQPTNISTPMISSNTTLVNNVEEIVKRRNPRAPYFQKFDDTELEDYFQHHHHPSPADSAVSEIKPRRYIFIETTTTKSKIVVSSSLAPPKYTASKQKRPVVQFKTILGKKSKPSIILANETKPSLNFEENSQRNKPKISSIPISVKDSDENGENMPETGHSVTNFGAEKTAEGVPLNRNNLQNLIDNSLATNFDSNQENTYFQNLPIKKPHLEKRSEDGHKFRTSSDCLESDSNEIANEETDETVIMEEMNLRGNNNSENSKIFRTNQPKGNFLSKGKGSLKNETITIVEIITETKDKTHSNDQTNTNFSQNLNHFENILPQLLDTTKNKIIVGSSRKPETSNAKISSSSRGSHSLHHLQNTTDMQPNLRGTNQIKSQIISDESLGAERKTNTIQNVSTNRRILHNFTEHVNLQSTPTTVKTKISYSNNDTLTNHNRVKSEKSHRSSIFKNESAYKLIIKNETRPKLKNNSVNNYVLQYPQRKQNLNSNLAFDNENISQLSVKPMLKIGNFRDVFENSVPLHTLQQGQNLHSILPEGFENQNIHQSTVNPTKKIGDIQYAFETEFPLQTLLGQNSQSTLPKIFPNTKTLQVALKPINTIGKLQDFLENSFPLQNLQQGDYLQQEKYLQYGQKLQQENISRLGQNQEQILHKVKNVHQGQNLQQGQDSLRGQDLHQGQKMSHKQNLQQVNHYQQGQKLKQAQNLLQGQSLLSPLPETFANSGVDKFPAKEMKRTGEYQYVFENSFPVQELQPVNDFQQRQNFHQRNIYQKEQNFHQEQYLQQDQNLQQVPNFQQDQNLQQVPNFQQDQYLHEGQYFQTDQHFQQEQKLQPGQHFLQGHYSHPGQNLQKRQNFLSSLPGTFENTSIAQVTVKPTKKTEELSEVFENNYPLHNSQQEQSVPSNWPGTFKNPAISMHIRKSSTQDVNYQDRFARKYFTQKLQHNQRSTSKRPSSLESETIIKLPVPAERKHSDSPNFTKKIYSPRNANRIYNTELKIPSTFKDEKTAELKNKSESVGENVEDVNDSSTLYSKHIKNVQSKRPRAFKNEVITKVIIETGSKKSKRPNVLENFESDKVEIKSGAKRETNTSYFTNNRFLKNPKVLKLPPSKHSQLEPNAASRLHTKTKRSKIQYDLTEDTVENFNQKKLKEKHPVTYIYSQRALTSKIVENKIVSNKEPELEIENSNSVESKKIKTHKKHGHKGHKMLNVNQRGHHHRHKSKNKRKSSSTKRKHRKRKKKQARLKDKEKHSKHVKHKEKHGKHKHVKHKRNKTKSENQENTKNSAKLRIHVHGQNSDLNFRTDYKTNQINSSVQVASSQQKIKALSTNDTKTFKKKFKKTNLRTRSKKHSAKVPNKIQTSKHVYIKQAVFQNFNDTPESLQSAGNTKVPRFKIRAQNFATVKTNNSVRAHVKFRARVPHFPTESSTLKRLNLVISTNTTGEKFKNLKQKQSKIKPISVKKKKPLKLKTTSGRIKFKHSVKMKTNIVDHNFTDVVRFKNKSSKKITFKSNPQIASPKTELKAKVSEFSIGPKTPTQNFFLENLGTFHTSNLSANLPTIKTHPNKSENIPSPEFSILKTKMPDILSEKEAKTASTRTLPSVFSVVGPGVEFNRELSEENNFGLQTLFETSTANSVKISHSFKTKVSEKISQKRNGTGKRLKNSYFAKTGHSVSFKSLEESVPTTNTNETAVIKSNSKVNRLSKEDPSIFKSLNNFTSPQNHPKATNPKADEASQNVSMKPEIKQNIQITIIFQGGDSNNSKIQTNFNQNGTFNVDATILNAILKNALQVPVQTQTPSPREPTGEPGMNKTNLTNEETMRGSRPIQGRGFQFLQSRRIQNSNNVSRPDSKFANANETANSKSDSDSPALKMDLKIPASTEIPKFPKTTEDYGALHPEKSNSKNETGRHRSKMQELVEAYKKKDFYSKKHTAKKGAEKAKGRSVLPVKHPPTQKPKRNFPPLGRSAGGPKRYRLIDLIEENIKKG
ncbi:unnamed protein product, partial [Allacma fusca]